LFAHLLRHVRSCDDLNALLDVALTYNADFDEPLSDDEVVKTAQSAWRYQEEGRNWVGGRSHIGTDAVEMDALKQHSFGGEALLLLLHLRLAHWKHPTFAVSPKAMAAASVISWWGKSPARYRRARDVLVETGLLRVEHEGGTKPGDPHLYSLSGK
jgi:hypothetical protein